VELHRPGHAWNGGASWLFVAGLVILAVAAIGVLAVNRNGTRRLRRDRAALREQNEDLADRLGLTTDEEAHASAEERHPGSQRGQRRIFHRHRAAI
jgi:hypothetical protein